MGNDVLLIEKKEHIRTLILNRPEKRNSLTPDLLIKLTETLEEFAKDDEIRTIVIRGVGDKAFCAGYDISALPNKDSSQPDRRTDPNLFENAMEAIVNYPYPVIAMMNGYAFGGGCDLAISCDIRIGADDIRLGMVPAKLGVVYFAGGLQRFVRVVGLSRAKELFYTGRTFDAQRLKEIGLVNFLLPKKELESFTYNMAEEIAGNAPLSLKGIKRTLKLLTHTEGMSEEDLRESSELVAQSFMSDDFKEGQMAFLEKRKPVFKGK